MMVPDLKANNISYAGLEFVEEYNAELPCFTLAEKSAEEWNAQAKTMNTKAFVETFGRNPVNYQEVKDWVNSFTEQKGEI